ncbi:MAG TPA: AMP-binding protein, partial [Candidatus Saccharimonadales bacterium]|nr:AMP-binding protein [Candidatus Saccharimonadales bacterium]
MFVPLSVLEFRDRAETYFGANLGVVDGERRLTYRAFGERTHRLANALRGLGIESGDRVSFITYNTHHLLEAYYGVLEAGAVLNPINIRLAPHEIAYILDHAGSRLVAFHRDFLPLVDSIAPQLVTRPQFVILDGEPGGIAVHEYEALLAAGSPDPLHPQIDENAIAELFYTSGTTGLPKGVAMTHRELHLHALYAELGLGFTEDDVVLHVVPLFHVNGWGTPHFLTMVGGRHVMLRRFDPVALMEQVQQHAVTRLLAVPAIFNAVLNHGQRSRFDLSSLRQVIIGGSPASPALVRALEEQLGVQAIVGYGLTETSPILTLALPRSGLTRTEPEDRRLERQAMTGWPIPGARIRVVQGDGRDVRPDGEQIGEILARGNTI